MKLIPLVLGLLLFLPGCVSDPYPTYMVSSLGFDEELLGQWRSVENEQNADDAFELRFSARPIVVVGDRLPTDEDHPGWFGKRRVVEQYTLEYSDNDNKMQMLGYLIESGDSRLLGIQLDPGDHASFLMLPVHAVMKLHRDGDALTLWMPNDFVVWLPQIEPVDGPENPAQPIPERESDAAIRVTSSIDRLLAYYAVHAEDDNFWTDTPLPMRRVESDEPADTD